jgi:hypothetical protein
MESRRVATYVHNTPAQAIDQERFDVIRMQALESISLHVIEEH